MDIEKQIQRGRLLSAVRSYFEEREFLEVLTPTRLEMPALEDYIDAVTADGRWLRTSPELQMKRLVAGGMEKIYQLGSCFRAGEFGRRHRSEFTMLEWYDVGLDYRGLLRFTEEMIVHVAAALDVLPPEGFSVLTVDDAFLKYAGVSAFDACRDGIFDELLVDKVEPALVGAVFLIDYPIELAALSRQSADNPAVAERWELYINGLEIANAYGELTDPVEQRRRFEETARLREADGRDVYPVDEAFMQVLANMPETSGCALGIDRLQMALTGEPDIRTVIPWNL